MSESEKAGEPNHLRMIILVGILILSYFFSVFWSAWSYKTTAMFFRTIGSVPCLKKYYTAQTPDNSGPNFWLLENYEAIYFRIEILSDAECTGKLVALGTRYIQQNPEQHQLAIHFLDPATMKIISSITIKP